MGDLTESESPSIQAPAPRQFPFREDCWTEEATSTLVDAWGRRYVELNRGNLRQKDWQEVADVVNAQHGQSKKNRRTDVQCKNRIDTLKKKYKVEKTKIAESNGTLTSSWPFFSRLEQLIGNNLVKHQNSKSTISPLSLPSYQSTPTLSFPAPPMAVPLHCFKPSSSVMFPRSLLPQKRPQPLQTANESYFRRNYSAIESAAVAEDELDGEEDERESEGEEAEGNEGRGEEEMGRFEGMTRLAQAMERFGEIYEKVESMKYRHIVELEKQRMQFAKDLEVQRMQLLMDTQVQLLKMKKAKPSGSSEVCISRGRILGVLHVLL